MTRLEEVMQRLGSRPALIHMANAADSFGDAAPYRIEDGVAIVDVRGLLLNADISAKDCADYGITTYGSIQNQIKISCADPSVKAILLNVNSPGGSTDNAFETAAVIAAIEKPCYAVANTSAYSAAYLLASQADRLYCLQTTGGVGSIGVYCAHKDYSEMLKQVGIKVTLISAGEGKTDGNPYEPLSESALQNVKGEIDRLYGEFVGAVATGRGISPVAIVKMGARCIEGASAAIAAGLADAQGDLSTAWVDLCTEIQRPKMPSSMMAAAKQNSVASATGIKEQQSMAEVTVTAAADATQTAAATVTAPVVVSAAPVDETGAILELCAIAGKSASVASEFLAKKFTRAQASAELLKMRAAESGPETASHILADAGTSTEAKPSQSAVVRACEALAKKGRA